MINSNLFNTLSNIIQRQRIGKLVYKIPMKTEVITQSGEVWKYTPTKNGIVWSYLYSAYVYLDYVDGKNTN